MTSRFLIAEQSTLKPILDILVEGVRSGKILPTQTGPLILELLRTSIPFSFAFSCQKTPMFNSWTRMFKNHTLRQVPSPLTISFEKLCIPPYALAINQEIEFSKPIRGRGTIRQPWKNFRSSTALIVAWLQPCLSVPSFSDKILDNPDC